MFLRRKSRTFAVFSLALAAPAFAATYYVNPTGSDANDGSDPSSPWQTVAKVNATALAPGSSVLFARGGEWRESLAPIVSGTAAAPIAFADYGSTALAKPMFTGSDVLNTAAFSAVAGTTSTYAISMNAPWVGSVLSDHQFLHSAELIDPSRPASAVVRDTPNTWYYDTPSATLYVNTTAPTAHTLTAVTREDAIYNNGQSHLRFSNLVADETARANSGYAIRVQNGSDVQLNNCDAFGGGKHDIGVINSTGFVANGGYVANLMPDQGFGGATALVAYSDWSVSHTTSEWNNITVGNLNTTDYSAYYNHGEGLGTVTLRNLTSNGYRVTLGGLSDRSYVYGGTITNAHLEVTGNTTVDGIRIIGGYNQVSVSGSNNILQNSVISGGDMYWGYHGAIVESGSNNIYRFNTIVLDGNYANWGGALSFAQVSTGDQFYGNIVISPKYIFKNEFNGSPLSLDSNHNLFLGDLFIQYDSSTVISLIDWQALGGDLSSLIGDPLFVSAGNGDYSLLEGSPAIGAYLASYGGTVATDFYGNLRPLDTGLNMGAIENVPEVQTALILLPVFLLLRSRRRIGS